MCPSGCRLWDVLLGGRGDWGCSCLGKCGASSWTWSGVGHLSNSTWSPCLVQLGHHCHDSSGGVLCLLGPALKSMERVGLPQLLWHRSYGKAQLLWAASLWEREGLPCAERSHVGCSSLRAKLHTTIFSQIFSDVKLHQGRHHGL